MNRADYDAMVAGQMLEGVLLQRCRDAAGRLGLLVYHTHDSRRSEPGFPDLVIAGPRGVLFRELKRQKANPTRRQQEWLDRLREAGADADVWRPADLLDDRIDRELADIAPERRWGWPA